MGNLCENRLRATGSEAQLQLLAAEIKKRYITDNYEEDYIESDDNYQLDLYFDSSWRFPQDDFKQILSQMTDTKDLFVRVASDEPVLEYLEQSIFRDGKWNFDNNPSIIDKMKLLKDEGINYIKLYLSENGDIKGLVEEGNTPPSVYSDCWGMIDMSYFDEILLYPDGSLLIELWDGASLGEQNLTINNVLEILTIINDKSEKL